MKKVHLNEAEAAKAYAKQVGKAMADKEFAEMAERYSGDARIADVDAAMAPGAPRRAAGPRES